MSEKYWLLKAEPDSRIVKGKDVKFSVDDFESVKTSPWEGVRNYEARNLMKEMKIGEKALFYHSNCKTPGVAAFAEVSKEAYPDYTAWDATHPYYDPKSDESSPRWYMVDLTFKSRASNFVPLSLLKYIADSGLPEGLDYIGDEGVQAIKSMDLVTRGRLSVQRVEKPAWDAIVLLADKGGWSETIIKANGSGSKTKGGGGGKSAKTSSAKPKAKSTTTTTSATPKAKSQTRAKTKSDSKTNSKRRKIVDEDKDDSEGDVDDGEEEEYEDAASAESEFSEEGDDDEYGKKKRKRKSVGGKRKASSRKEHAEAPPSTRTRARNNKS